MHVSRRARRNGLTAHTVGITLANLAASAGMGSVVTRDGLLSWPLAMAWTPQKHMLVTNGKNGQVVEVDPATGKQIYAQWIANDQAQSPPGDGDLFGLAMIPDGTAFYYAEDDMNTLVSASASTIGSVALAGKAVATPPPLDGWTGVVRGVNRSMGRTRRASFRRRKTNPISPRSIPSPTSAPRLKRGCGDGARRWRG